MRLIGFGELSIRLLYIPLTPICNSIRYFFAELLNEMGGVKYHPFTFCFLMFFSESLSGLVSLNFYFLNKRYKPQAIHSERIHLSRGKRQISLLKENTKASSNVHLFLFVSLYSLLDLIATLALGYASYHYGYVSKKRVLESNLDFEMKTIGILYNSVLSYFILHNSLFKHQILSLVLIVIGICLVIIPNLSQHDYLLSKMLLFILTFLLPAVQSTLEKRTMKDMFLHPALLRFFEGLIGLVITSLLAALVQFAIPRLIEPIGTFTYIYQETAAMFRGVLILYFFLMILFSSCYNLFLLLVNYHYSPMHCCVADLLSSLIFWVLLMINNRTLKTNVAFSVIGYIILLTGILVYNEIVILYCGRMHLDTVKEIKLRSLVEYTMNTLEAINDINNAIELDPAVN